MLVIIKMSPRRFVLANAEPSPAWYSQRIAGPLDGDNEMGFTLANAELLAGPTTWELCIKAAAEHTRQNGTLVRYADFIDYTRRHHQPLVKGGR